MERVHILGTVQVGSTRILRCWNHNDSPRIDSVSVVEGDTETGLSPKETRKLG